MTKSQPLYYVDRSDVRAGGLDELRAGMRDLAAFVEEREPRLLAYHFYLDEPAATMTVLAVHPDSASLEFHLELGGPRFRALGAHIRLRTIDVYGDPSPEAVTRLRAKAEMLGGREATVTLHTHQAGFSRPDL
ncbi:hypothetical protein ACIRSU_30720 [Streptomyces sp. NPDC101160]|uniref:hypothetical protein n=1 Tax=Streptomyces sp. NPDC101160 TaxID=3366118 RepID=UPI0038121192